MDRNQERKPKALDVEALRAQIPALQRATYLNSGTFGPMPRVVTEEVIKAYQLVSEHGPFSPVVRDRIECEGYERTRSQVAALLSATPDEIALTRSTSDGICIVAYGLDWQPGDRVIITDQEHPSGELPWFILHRRYGLDVHIVRLAREPHETLQRFRVAITPRTRLLFASHLCCTTGERLPVRDLCALAHEQGTLVAIDGAHAAGQFSVDLADLDPDFYITCGHKWLLGPQGTSMLYVASRHLDTLQPSWIGWGAQEPQTEDLEALSFKLLGSARRFEYATKAWPLFLGLRRSVEFIESVGLTAIEARVSELAAVFKAGIVRIPGLTLLTPQQKGRSAGLVSVLVEGHQGSDLGKVLWERWRILAASSLPGGWVRFSIAFFTLQDELDLALEALRTLAEEAAETGR
jgi:selenocysteine lyase/cysteine desulfurase